MQVTVTHCEAGHAAIVAITTDTGAVVTIDVGNLFGEHTDLDGHGCTVRVDIDKETVLDMSREYAAPTT